MTGRQTFRERIAAGLTRRWLALASKELHRQAGSPRIEDDPYHRLFDEFLALLAAGGARDVVEIGARAVSGNVYKSRLPATVKYVGFDFHPGPNVDVVGDAHTLSRHFPAESVDAVFCFSVFEHLAMPWRVVLEMNRILRPGGLVFVATHGTWPAHERPWDFWRFSRHAFEVLFLPEHGFDLIKSVEGLPCSIVAHSSAPPLQELAAGPAFLAVAALARKRGPPQAGLDWPVDVTAALATHYPLPAAEA